MRELKLLMNASCWILFLAGLITLALGVYYRFATFDDFKLWQGAMGLGIGVVFLSGILAFLRNRTD